MKKKSFIQLVGAVTVINIISQLFGFAREVSIGYQYGTSYSSDSIITAFTIPNFLYIVIGGSITTAFISVYSKLEGERKHEFVQSLFTILAIISGALTILFMLFPKFWIELFFSGMAPEALALTSDLFVITAPATMFLILSMLLSGLHNTHGNYRLSSFSSFLFNATYLIIGFGLTPFMMEYSYSLGAALGSLFMFLILIYQIRKQRLMPFQFKLRKLPEGKRFLQLVLPLILGGATMQFYIIIQRMYSAGLEEGTIAAVNYASKMAQYPQGVLMASITTIIYPMLAKSAGEGDMATLKEVYCKGFRMLTLVLLPAIVFIVIFSEEIITVIFEYGSFSANSTNLTYPLLQVFAFAIFSLSLNTYITRFFYAMEETLLPNILNIISVFGINIAVISLTIDDLGAKAIALGTVVSTIVNMLLLLFFAKRKLQLIPTTWRYIVRLALFIIIVVIFLALIANLTSGYLYISLLVGGLATLLFIATGLKFVK